MSSELRVCFKCREIKKIIRQGHQPYERVGMSDTCPKCGDDMVRVSSSNTIPKKKDNKGWRDFESKITELENKDDRITAIKKSRINF